MDISSFILGLKMGGGGGGGSSVTVEALTATENKTYTAPTGKAYSPVTVNVPTGGGGLEYEEGTWTPSEDIDRYRIPLKNEHTTPPAIYVIVDSTGTNAPANSCMHVCYTDDTFFGGPMLSALSGTAKIYGYAYYVCMTSSNSSPNRKTLNAKATSGDPSGYSNTNARFWATESSIYAFCDSSSYLWRSGRTYKWFALWLPEAE